jgi:hypothetical protein
MALHIVAEDVDAAVLFAGLKSSVREQRLHGHGAIMTQFNSNRAVPEKVGTRNARRALHVKLLTYLQRRHENDLFDGFDPEEDRRHSAGLSTFGKGELQVEEWHVIASGMRRGRGC